MARKKKTDLVGVSEEISEIIVDDTVEVNDTTTEVEVNDTTTEVEVNDTTTEVEVDDTVEVNDTTTEVEVDDTVEVNDTTTEVEVNDTTTEVEVDDTVKETFINGFKILSRSDLKSLTPQEAQSQMKKSTAAYTNKINHIKIPKLLTVEENAVMEIMAKYDAYLTEIEYSLPSQIDFENNIYSLSYICDNIKNFLDRVVGEWNFAQSLYDIYTVWNRIKSNLTTKISYKLYASTLNWLGNQKFSGFSDWFNILIVNKFLNEINQQYVYDMIYQYYLADLHNAIINRTEKLSGKKK